MKLQSKTALITGGNSGIGLATAQLFIAEGARVAITGRNRNTLDAAAKDLGPNALAFNSDVLDSKARDVLFATIKEKFGHLDIVFANAGIGNMGSIEETSEATFDEVLRTNVSWRVLHHPGSASSFRGGRIHHFEWFDRANCRLSTRCRILCCQQRGPSCDEPVDGAELAPAAFASTSWRLVSSKLRFGNASPAPEDVVTALTKKLLGSVPLDRWGQAEEVAKAVLFLASDDSSYVHGSEIIVDGGVTGTMYGGPIYRG